MNDSDPKPTQESNVNLNPAVTPVPNEPTGAGQRTDAYTAQPVLLDERDGALDVLRGFALMGVLLMNMQAYAMPFCAYMNPPSFRADDPLNMTLWTINHVMADAKFITIFSMLFGAGIILMTTRAVQKTGRCAWLHYRRMFWLALFGASHGILIWYGDILLTYAICGCIVFFFRNRSIRFLVIASLILFMLPTLMMVTFETYFAQKMSVEERGEMMRMWAPTAEQLQEQLDIYRGSFMTQLPERFKAWASMFGFLMFFIWRILGNMLIGMALYKAGILSARKSETTLGVIAAFGFALGLPLAALGIHQNAANGWTMEFSFGIGSLYNYVGSLLAAFGWIGLVTAVYRTGVAPNVQARFAAVGRMAFTNYIMHSVICTLIFNGHGLGYFGHVNRITQLALVLAIGGFQLWYSPWWLRHFRFGPLEWLWRSLAYWRLQPVWARLDQR